MMRSGFTLAELVVALAVGGVAFGAFTAVVRDQERASASLAHRIHALAQAREGLAPLVLELRSLSPASGDIAPGTARDSAIELRASVADFIVCAVHERSLVTALGSVVAVPKVGDTAWALVAGDSAAWQPRAVTSVGTVAVSDTAVCALSVLAPGASDRAGRGSRRYLVELAQLPPESVGEGTPVRVTRRVRYSLYRAPDSRWYLGRREFSAALGRFETIQPVSGPYAAYAPVADATAGLELRYFDRNGTEIDAGATSTERIARVDITLRTLPPVGVASPRQRDVTSVTVGLRNAR